MEDVARPHFFSTVYGAAASSASSFVHHTQQISMDGGGRWRATPETHQQAGAQDAYQLGHEQANGTRLLTLAATRGGRPRRLARRTAPPPFIHVRIM